MMMCAPLSDLRAVGGGVERDVLLARAVPDGRERFGSRKRLDSGSMASCQLSSEFLFY